jgi:cbb3-type cytochrome oxidase maturation protein
LCRRDVKNEPQWDGSDTAASQGGVLMNALLYLIPISIVLGAIALFTFLWSLNDGQYEDLDGAANRILTDDDKPLPQKSNKRT